MNSEETKPIPTPPLSASSLSVEELVLLKATMREKMAIDAVVIECLKRDRDKFAQELHAAKSTMDEAQPQQPKTKGKAKQRGVGDKSFREVSPNGELEPNLAYTIKQAAEFLQLSEDLVLKMCKNRTLKSSQHENAYRIKGSVILDYLEGK
jgi:hypothetical protein